MKTILHIFVLSLLFTFNAYAQRTEEVRDTLSASIKEASRFVNSGINGYQVRIGDVHNLISPSFVSPSKVVSSYPLKQS